MCFFDSLVKSYCTLEQFYKMLLKNSFHWVNTPTQSDPGHTSTLENPKALQEFRTQFSGMESLFLNATSSSFLVQALIMVEHIPESCFGLQAAITKYHRSSDLKNKCSFLIILEFGSLRSRCQEIWLLVRAYAHLLTVSLHRKQRGREGGRERELWPSSSY